MLSNKPCKLTVGWRAGEREWYRTQPFGYPHLTRLVVRGPGGSPCGPRVPAKPKEEKKKDNKKKPMRDPRNVKLKQSQWEELQQLVAWIAAWAVWMHSPQKLPGLARAFAWGMFACVCRFLCACRLASTYPYITPIFTILYYTLYIVVSMFFSIIPV